MTSISTIIINHNKKELLKSCLESVVVQKRVSSEIIVVDNASDDGSLELVQQQFPQANLIKNNNNKSFAASCNQGIRVSHGEFVLILNNDVVLDKNFFSGLLLAMENNKEIGIAGGKVLDVSRRYIDSAGQLLSKSRSVLDRGYQELDKGQYDLSGYIFGISASAALYRREMLDDIKEGGEYFDEDFAFFYEDIDIAWRAQKRGWKAFYTPKALAFHCRGATTKTKRPRPWFLRNYYIPHLQQELQYFAIRNRYLAAIKNDSLKDMLKDLLYVIRYELKQLFYILLFSPGIIIRLVQNKGIFRKMLQKRTHLYRREAKCELH